MAPLPPAPNVVLLGFERNASRWLRFNLDRHPQILMPPVETDFFTDEVRMARLGHRWYREQFRDWDGEPLLGEFAPGYCAFLNQPNRVVERLRKHLPDARYVVVLGDPVERLVASARRMVRRGALPADLDLDAFCRFAVEPEIGLQMVAEGMLSPGVRAFVDRFGDRVAPVLIEDIRRDPEATYRGVLDHIGADPSFVPDQLDLVRYDDEHVVTAPGPGLEARQLVYAWYRQDVTVLAELLDLDLSHWDPGEGSAPSANELMDAFLAATDADRTAS